MIGSRTSIKINVTRSSPGSMVPDTVERRPREGTAWRSAEAEATQVGTPQRHQAMGMSICSHFPFQQPARLRAQLPASAAPPAHVCWEADAVPGTTACGLGFLTTWWLGPKGVCIERQISRRTKATFVLTSDPSNTTVASYPDVKMAPDLTQFPERVTCLADEVLQEHQDLEIPLRPLGNLPAETPQLQTVTSQCKEPGSKGFRSCHSKG